MSSDRGKKADGVSPATAVTRHKRRNFTEEVYGARLPFEDARVIDDYAKAHRLDRSEVVRQGLHEFALRQQMRYHKKDPLRESLEQVVGEQIAPVHQRTEEIMVMLNDLAGFFVEQGRRLPDSHMKDSDGSVSSPPKEGLATPPYAQVFSEQKQLLEQTLMAVMLALRLHVNYLVEPVLSASEAASGGEAAKHLRAAILGRDEWCETTRKVIARTGKRLLYESNFITQEDWKNLLASYRAEDGQGTSG